MNEATKADVRRRAKDRCEYCALEQPYSPGARFHIEHIRPKKHGGDDDLGNLCLACSECNLRKGTNLTGIDPDTDAITELFNPRRHRWDEHFEWVGVEIVGRTAIGRTTIVVLDVNSDDQIELRLP